MLDKNAQPHPNFSIVRNRKKALFSLLGLCQGLIADETLSAQEALFLDQWLRNCGEIASDPDVVDIIDLVTDILKDGMVTADELEDLMGLLDSVVRNRDEFGSEPDEINKLLAVLRGLTSDRRINDREITYLQNWMDSNLLLSAQYPADVIIHRINSIVADGVITEAERLDLLQLLDSITGDRFEETGLAYGLSTEFCTQNVNRLDHHGKLFCFTGKFVSGPRTIIEKSAIERGALTTSRITRKLDVLVIGTIASRDWRFTAHGRKIEAAIHLQRKGHPLLIISERHWREHL